MALPESQTKIITSAEEPLFLRRPQLGLLINLCFGCATVSPIETRTYALHRRTTEEPLIAAVVNDELEKADENLLSAAVKDASGQLMNFEITPDNVAIVRTTSRGHDAIRKALKDLEIETDCKVP
ncbi:hypothetical protein BH11PLA2_BH11PLA2_48890 [soil metagenome]